MANQSQTKEQTRRYEIGYLVAPTVPEDEVEEIAEGITDTIADHGEVLANQIPEMKELAYTMEVTTSAGEREFDRGQFGWVQFTVTPNTLDDTEAAFDETEDIMRHLLIRIDEEDVGVRSRGEGDDNEEKSENDDAEDVDSDAEDGEDEQGDIEDEE